MQIAIVRAAARDGFSGAWSAGRHWPSEGTRIVEVVSTDEDPAPEQGEHLNQNRIGRAALRELQDAAILSVNLRYARTLEEAREGKIFDAPVGGEKAGITAADKAGTAPPKPVAPEPDPDDTPRAKRRR